MSVSGQASVGLKSFWPLVGTLTKGKGNTTGRNTIISFLFQENG